jgi:hypothetical protein
MSYAEVTAARGGSAPVDCLPAAAPTPLHHVTYLQGFAVLIDLRAVKPNLSKEERNQFAANHHQFAANHHGVSSLLTTMETVRC